VATTPTVKKAATPSDKPTIVLLEAVNGLVFATASAMALLAIVL
jgi:hypothetical protein